MGCPACPTCPALRASLDAANARIALLESELAELGKGKLAPPDSHAEQEQGPRMPLELLIPISSHLNPKTHSKTLANLSMTCKAAYELLSSHRFRTLSVSDILPMSNLDRAVRGRRDLSKSFLRHVRNFDAVRPPYYLRATQLAYAMRLAVRSLACRATTHKELLVWLEFAIHSAPVLEELAIGIEDERALLDPEPFPLVYSRQQQNRSIKRIRFIGLPSPTLVCTVSPLCINLDQITLDFEHGPGKNPDAWSELPDPIARLVTSVRCWNWESFESLFRNRAFRPKVVTELMLPADRETWDAACERLVADRLEIEAGWGMKGLEALPELCAEVSIRMGKGDAPSSRERTDRLVQSFRRFPGTIEIRVSHPNPSGKIDSETDEEEGYRYFIRELRDAGIPIVQLNPWGLPSYLQRRMEED